MVMTHTPARQATDQVLVDILLHEYHQRQTRQEHPAGAFDKAGRFYLAPEELTACCREIRPPSRAYPFSQMVHGRTLKHLANLRGVDPSVARKALARLIAHQRPANTAPSGLCVVCGASWACEHQAPESADMQSISIREASAQFDRHLAGTARNG